ncbi:MAG: DNA-binding protein [Streptosporangiales bacterium]|nr:DNA-binding protein [Streptosporangiales bacterium]
MSTASSVPDPDDPTAWLSLADLAEHTGEQPKKIRQLVREDRLVTVKRAGTEHVPAAFVADGRLLKGLGGVTTLLHDAGYNPDESLRWLFTENDVLGVSPVQAMAEGRPTEVKRVAQTLGF